MHRRKRWFMFMALVVLLPVVPTPATPVGPAGADIATLRTVRVLDKTLTGAYTNGGTSEPYSSPAIGDITGDGVPEIVSATLDGTVIAYRSSDYSVLWIRSLGAVALQASPVLADVGGDGKADVVIGTMSGKVYWFDGPTGATARSFGEGAPLFCPAGVDCRPSGFFATPTVADITGDGRPEIVAASWDHTVYAWQRSGALVFRTFLYDTLWSSPVVVDIDGNGSKEIVLGGDIYAGNPLGVSAGGLVWALNRTGSIYSGYPKSIPGQTVWSSPAVTDLNGDGVLDVVVGTGTNGPFGDGATARRVHAFNVRTRGNLPGWPVSVEGRVSQGPAVGDIDADGRKEVVFGSEGGYVYAYDDNGGRKWRACAAVGDRCSSGYATHGSAVIADVDNDGEQEVVAALDKDLFVYDGSSGAEEASYRMTDGKTLAPPSLPAIGETAGKTIIVQQTVWRTDGHGGPAQAGDKSRLHVLTTDKPLCLADWPMFKHDARRSGFLTPGSSAWLPFDCARPFVIQQYRDFLGREPDAAGLRYWTGLLNAGRSGPQIIQSFMDSPEFGRVRAPLVRMHVAMTSRPPVDFAAFESEADRYAASTTLAALANELARNPSTVDSSGTRIVDKSNAAFVRDTFRFTFGREPFAAEQEAGQDLLAGGMSRGTWLVSKSELASAETRLTPNVYVSMSYIGMLARVPDENGYLFWVPRVRAGTSIQQLIASFQRSTEYGRRVT